MRSTWTSAGYSTSPRARPVHLTGTVHSVIERAGERWVSVRFGRGNVLVITPYLEQIIEPSTLTAIGLDPAAFKVIAIKSRAHFRRGFDDSGFAKTIMLVEPPHPFLGTVHLDALPYRNVDLKRVLSVRKSHVPVGRKTPAKAGGIPPRFLGLAECADAFPPYE